MNGNEGAREWDFDQECQSRLSQLLGLAESSLFDRLCQQRAGQSEGYVRGF